MVGTEEQKRDAQGRAPDSHVWGGSQERRQMLREPPRKTGCAVRESGGGMVRRMEKCPEGDGTRTEEPEE